MSPVVLGAQSVEFLFALCISIVSVLEVWSISNSLVRGDPDLSHGLQIRRWFMGAIGGASGARAVCTLCEVFYEYMCAMLSMTPSYGLLTSFRALPTLLYYTMYTLLTVYLAQLVYTVNGMPFFHVRNVWFFANFSLYLVVISAVVFVPSPTYVYGAFFLAFTVDLLIVGWYGTQLFKFLPAPPVLTASSGKLAGAGASSSFASAAAQAKIRSRLMPLIVVCCLGVSMSCLNFLLLATEVLPSRFVPRCSFAVRRCMHDSSTQPPNHPTHPTHPTHPSHPPPPLHSASATKPFPWQEFVEILALACSEIIPSLAFLFLTPKTDTSFEEPSLLSIVVNAASGLILSTQRDERYQLVSGSTGINAQPNYQSTM